jgi:hypothetical protein
MLWNPDSWCGDYADSYGYCRLSTPPQGGRSKMTHEYHEGPKALANFKAGMSRLLKTPKESLKDKVIPKRPSVRPAKG